VHSIHEKENGSRGLSRLAHLVEVDMAHFEGTYGGRARQTALVPRKHARVETAHVEHHLAGVVVVDEERVHPGPH
jgi:hypothetical protein